MNNLMYGYTPEGPYDPTHLGQCDKVRLDRPEQLAGHRIPALRVFGTLSHCMPDVNQFCEWLYRRIGNLRIGDLRKSEPRGTLKIGLVRGHNLYVDLDLCCEQDILDIIDQLQNFRVKRANYAAG